jgi:ERCC4-type nuclease
MVTGVEHKALFERKTISDFISSSRGRIWKQLIAISDAHKEQHFHVGLIIEGTLVWDTTIRKRYKNVLWTTWLARRPNQEASFYMSQFSSQRFKVPFILTKDPTGTAIFLAELDKKFGSATKVEDYPLRDGFRKDYTLPQKKSYLMEAFGKETGKALLKNYKTISNLIYTLGYDATLGRWEPNKEFIVNMIANVEMESGRRIGPAKALEVYEVLWM